MNPPNQHQHVIIQIARNFKGININTNKIEKLVKNICNRFKLYKAVISIAILDDDEICRVNKQFLNRRFATDCLSFDLSDDADSAKSFEVVVNAEKAVRESGLRDHLAESELALYITHGLLHNLGFDDSTPTEAKKMHDIEDEILQQQGYGLVYNKSIRT